MNWGAKDRSEIALNRIWSEHVRAPARSVPRRRRRFTVLRFTHVCVAPGQVEKEKHFMKPKTKYTCNPCSSIGMNNGLGSRGARAPNHS